MHGLRTIVQINNPAVKPALCSSCKFHDVPVGVERLDPCSRCFVNGKSGSKFVPRFTRTEKAKLLVGWVARKLTTDWNETQ
jgi:hypothetical protein